MWQKSKISFWTHKEKRCYFWIIADSLEIVQKSLFGIIKHRPKKNYWSLGLVKVKLGEMLISWINIVIVLLEY